MIQIVLWFKLLACNQQGYILRYLLLTLILLPVIEIATLLKVGDIFGFWPTLLGMILTTMLGMHILRSNGRSVWIDLQRQLQQGQSPSQTLARGACHFLAGILLLLPGFITDLLGLLLLIPAFGYLVGLSWARYFANRGQIIEGSYTTVYYSDENHQPINTEKQISQPKDSQK